MLQADSSFAHSVDSFTILLRVAVLLPTTCEDKKKTWIKIFEFFSHKKKKRIIVNDYVTVSTQLHGHCPVPDNIYTPLPLVSHADTLKRQHEISPLS